MELKISRLFRVPQAIKDFFASPAPALQTMNIEDMGKLKYRKLSHVSK